MRKILSILVLCLISIVCTFGFSACGVEFNVNFIVDGEIYATVNTNGAETIKMPDNPTKDDYTFDGWYWDKDTWEKPFTANSLLDAPLSSDMSVYAKFTKKHEHNYITVITAPTCAEKGYTTYTCECGNTYIDDYTDAFGHTPENAVEENGTEPKCEVKGGYDLVVYCKTCGAELSREHKEIAALTHEFTDYVSDNNATYDSDGTKTAYCNHGCGATNKITDVGTKLQSGIAFKTLAVDGNNAYGKIPNAQTEFDFLTEIEKKGNVSFNVSKNLAGDDIIVSKTVEPAVGDNKYYILVYQNGELLSRYNVTIRRRPIYTVTFNTDGGTAVVPQRIEEDSFVIEPIAPTRKGYNFIGWDYDFNEPIMSDTTITVLWNYFTLTTESNDTNAGTITIYNQTKTSIGESVTITATTNIGYTWLGWYNGEEKLTSELSYTFDMPSENICYTARWCYFTLTTTRNDISAGSVSEHNATKITIGNSVTLTATTNTGYTFIGWYNGDKELTKELSYTFAMPSENITYTAKWCKVTLAVNDTSAGTASLDETYFVGETITVTATTNVGYNFIGWYNGEQELTKELSYTFTMPNNNITYTAKWEITTG